MPFDFGVGGFDPDKDDDCPPDTRGVVTTPIKPMLASDADLAKVRFPCIIQPKIDGMRALNIGGRFVGRSLKRFGNSYIGMSMGHTALAGLDGEMAAESETHPDLCRITTSAVASHNGEPFILWHLFDYVTEETRDLPYSERLIRLHRRYEELRAYPAIFPHLRLVPSVTVSNMAQLEAHEAQWLDEGYEGLIIRDPHGKHKAGRSTVREGGLLRVKRFVDADAIVVSVEEGQSNANEPTLNPLGYTERSTHQANMIPNGQVGTIKAALCEEVKVHKDLTLAKGSIITVAPGKMTVELRAHYWENQDELKGRRIRFKFFPKGVKDALRFPTFQCFREDVDT